MACVWWMLVTKSCGKMPGRSRGLTREQVSIRYRVGDGGFERAPASKRRVGGNICVFLSVATGCSCQPLSPFIAVRLHLLHILNAVLQNGIHLIST